MKQIRKRLTYANVMSSIAVFLVLGGAAFAATKLPKNSVGTKQLKKNAVVTAKIKNNAVNGAKVNESTLGTVPSATNASHAGSADSANHAGSADNANHAVSADKATTAENVTDGSITTSKLANGSVTGAKLATNYLPESTPGVPLAGARVSSSGVVVKWFNRYGGEPTVAHLSTGVYVLTFPGLEGKAYYNQSVGTVSLGDIGEVYRGSSNGNPYIRTSNSSGAAEDIEFDFVLFVPSP